MLLATIFSALAAIIGIIILSFVLSIVKTILRFLFCCWCSNNKKSNNNMDDLELSDDIIEKNEEHANQSK
jgi:hypothetical protein